LFPGYLFLHRDPRDPWWPARYAPGVYDFITNAEDKPEACRPGAVEAVQALEAEFRSPPTCQSRWRPGAACRLADGPFEGHDAVVLKVRRNMALVALMMFGCLRNVAVSLDCLVARD
jgi:transcription antitermination factor NusG